MTASNRITITPVRLGVYVRSYLIRGEGTILVDAGLPHHGAAFRRTLAALGVRPADIRLIVLTHGHFDHVGSAREIREATGAPIAIHTRDRRYLEEGVIVVPPGATPWGSVLSAGARTVASFLRLDPAPVGVEVGDDPLDLSAYGIPGRIVSTPGHTAGSVTLLLETGDAFIGDLAIGAGGLRTTPALPVLAEDLPRVYHSWERLIGLGARTCYPGHGRPFALEAIRPRLNRPRPGRAR